MRQIALKAYAKINVGLRILGLRDDGYHELRTIYQSVSLADDVAIQLSTRNGPVRLETAGFEVPPGAQNLAVRAAEAIRKELRIRRGIFLRLRKRIPPGSGLGGASSDAAAVLRGVLTLCGKTLPPERLLHLAADLGSDVPYFLVGGRALGVGRGEEVYALPENPRRAVVILFPGEGMSTVEAYRMLDIARQRPRLQPRQRARLTGHRARPTIELFCASAMAASLMGPSFMNASATEASLKDASAMKTSAARADNDFESLLFRRMPELKRAKRLMLDGGAEMVSLSGSGSAFFGMFRESAPARAAARQLQGSGAAVFITRTVTRREFFRPTGGESNSR